MREALDIVDFAAIDRERQGQRASRQGWIVERADGNMRLEHGRPDRSGKHVLVGPAARAFRRHQRPVADEIAYPDRRDRAFKLDGRRAALGQRQLAGNLKRQRRAADAQMIQNKFPRGRPPLAAQIDKLERNRIGENTRQYQSDLVQAHVGAHACQGAVRAGDEIDPALQASLDLVGVDRGLFEQQSPARRFVATDGAQAAHLHGPVLDAGQDECSACADAEVRRQQMRTFNHKRRRKIELQRGILDGSEGLGVGGEGTQFETGDRNRALDFAVPGREHKFARYMSRAPRNLDRGIELDVEIRSGRRQLKIGLRRNDEQARRFVEESQSRVADRKAFQRRRVALPRIDRIGEAAQDVAFLLVLLHT